MIWFCTIDNLHSSQNNFQPSVYSSLYFIHFSSAAGFTHTNKQFDVEKQKTPLCRAWYLITQAGKVILDHKAEITIKQINNPFIYTTTNITNNLPPTQN